MPRPSNLRREILIDSHLQLGLAMNMIGWLYFYVVAFAIVVNSPSIWAVMTAPETDTAYYDAVQRMQWFTQFTVIPLALTFVCVAAHSLVLTHRIAGPIYRIRTVLRGMAERKYPKNPVTLRDKDYFKDVALELTAVIETLREDAARERRMNQETLQGAQELLAAIDGASKGKGELLALAHLTLDRAERLDRHLSCLEPDGGAAPLPLPEADLVSAEAVSSAAEPANVTNVTADAPNS